MANLQPLHKDTHLNVKLKPLEKLDGLDDQHAIGVVVQEFALAGSQFPIAFVQQSEKKGYYPVAIMGLEPNKNLFVNDNGHWEGRYLPARYTHQPLAVAQDPEQKNQYAIAIDMDNEMVQEEEGQRLFKDDGSESEFLAARKKALTHYVENEHITRALCELLVQHGLLTPQSIKVKVKDKEYNLNGLYIVDEKKMNELPDEAFMEIKKRGFLAPIYAHLGSIHQVSSLIQRQDKLLAN